MCNVNYSVFLLRISFHIYAECRVTVLIRQCDFRAVGGEVEISVLFVLGRIERGNIYSPMEAAFPEWNNLRGNTLFFAVTNISFLRVSLIIL